MFCQKLVGKTEQEICHDCRAKILLNSALPKPPQGAFYDASIAAMRYDGQVREALHRFKFLGAQSYAVPLGRIMAYTLQNSDYEGDLLTYVAGSRKNMRKRGYNQAHLLARQVAKFTHLPMVDTLKKTRKTIPMFGLRPEQRRANVLGAFTLSCTPEKVSGKRVILVDDIITTGSTASECARVLKQAGALSVYVLVAAAAGKNNKLG